MRKKNILKEPPMLPPPNSDLQEEIYSKFGPDLVFQKRLKLCAYCRRFDHPCWLLPITTQGGDCPYFVSEGG